MTTTFTAPVVAEPRARFRDVVAAEWIKLWSLRSTSWVLVLSALAVLAFNVGTAYDTYRYWSQQNGSDRADFIGDGIPLLEAFTANGALVYMLTVGAIGALPVVGEYGTGMIRTTFTAVPDRSSVMAAKVTVIAAVTTAFGAALAAASFALTQTVLSGRDAGIGISHPGALRAVVASALLAPVCALAGMALGTLVRHGATTIAAVFAALVLLPAVLTDDRHWTAVLSHALPLNAWDRLAQPGGPPDLYPWTATGAWTVYGVWALASAAVAVTAVRRRDK
ncbi:ABC transporter permease [Streptomyces rectiviolaceus]|uniref:ABC transporter permease n=1 Tax=Streptomyces rectiviolaceus TaxID=332591 RepID=A0ABP6MIS9_9ACTN